MEHNVIQGIKRLFHQLVYWTSATQILIVRKWDALVQNKLFN